MRKTDKRHDFTEFNCKSFHFCTLLLKYKFSKSTQLLLQTLHHDRMQKPNYCCLHVNSLYYCKLLTALQVYLQVVYALWISAKNDLN